MSRSHPINQAVIAQVLDDLRLGQLRRAKSMGFEECDLSAMRNPEKAAILANASVSWCSVLVNVPVLRSLLGQSVSSEQEYQEIERLLRLGASTKLIAEQYGLGTQDIAIWRNLVKNPASRGRPLNLSDEQSAELWQQFKALTRAQQTDPSDERALLALSADLAEQTHFPFVSIWRSIAKWQAEGLL
jgi:hypothetical protein